MLFDALTSLIGPVPSGYEPLLYLGAVLVLLWLLSTVFSVLWSLLNWIGGK